MTQVRSTFAIILAVLLTVSGLFVSTAASAAPGVEVYIPDDALRACINDELGAPVDAAIDEAQMASLSSLNCTDGVRNISDLTGLEVATNLVSLDAMWQGISDLSPLRGLTKLKSLQLEGNQISDLSPLSRLPLDFVYLDFNAVSDLSPLWTTPLRALAVSDQTLQAVPAVVAGRPSPNPVVSMSGSPVRVDDASLCNADCSELTYPSGVSPVVTSWSHLFQLNGRTFSFWGSYEQEVISDPVSPTLSGNPLDGEVGVPYSFAFTVDGHPAPTVTLVSGNLPDGLTLSSTGVLSGTPTADGNFPFEIRAVNGANPDATLVATMTVAPDASSSSEVYMPDTDLRACVNQHLGQADDAVILKTELAAFTDSLSCFDMDIADLTGMEHATALTEATFYNSYGSELKDLSPLSGLTGLRQLSFSDGRISNLAPLSNLTDLEVLRLASNSVSDISQLKELTSLTELDLYNNQLTDISALEHLTQLQFLTLSRNQISDVSTLRNLTQLERLLLGQNLVSDISSLEGLTQLQNLDLKSNEVPNISALAPLKGLEVLNISDNPLTDIAPLSGHTKLVDLDISYNSIPDISHLADATKMERFIAQTNSITDMGVVADMTSLQVLYLDNNQISVIPSLANLDSLFLLQIGSNEISDVSGLEGMTGLETVSIGNNLIDDLTPLSGMQLSMLDASYNRITDLTSLAGIQITGQLALHNQVSPQPDAEVGVPVANPLRDAAGDAVPVDDASLCNADCSELTYPSEGSDVETSWNQSLTVSGTHVFFEGKLIRDVVPAGSLSPEVNMPDDNLRACVNQYLGQADGAVILESDVLGIEYLSCHDLGITDLAGLEAFSSMKWLNLDGNQFTNISALKDLNDLQSVTIAMSPVADISPLRGKNFLRTLDLRETRVADLSPLADLPELEWLGAQNADISDISDLENVTTLQGLYLSGNRIVDLDPLVNLNRLRTLQLASNRVSDATPIAGLHALRDVDLSDNQITDLVWLRDLTLLSNLNIGKNSITEITELSLLPELAHLTLADNQVSDITPVENLSILYYVDIAENNITNLSPLAGKNLLYLFLANNSITDLSPLAGMPLLVFDADGQQSIQPGVTVNVPVANPLLDPDAVNVPVTDTSLCDAGCGQLTFTAAGSSVTVPWAHDVTINGVTSPFSGTLIYDVSPAAPVDVAPTISGTPTAGTVGSAYSFDFTVTGTPVPTVTVESGDLPDGTALSSAGTLTGTPTAAGTYTFAVKAANGVNPDATLPVSLVINSAGPVGVAPTVTGVPVAGTAGTVYSFDFTVTGTPAPTVSVESGTLPAGVTLSSGGTLTGTPILAGTYNFVVKAANGVNPDATLPVTLTVDPAAPVNAAPTISGTPPAGKTTEFYSFTFTTTGTPAPTVTLESGTLPTGLTLDADGLLSGSPSTTGPHDFVVKASNGVDPDATLPVTLVVNAAPQIWGAPGDATVGTAYSYTFTMSGFPEPTVTVASGTLPDGMTLSAAGVLSGTPTTVGHSAFLLQASNGIDDGLSPGLPVTVTVLPAGPVDVAPTISGAPAAGTVGAAYSFDFAVTGTPVPTVSLESGDLPDGVTLSPAGSLSGTPTAAGSYTFTVKAANGVNPDATLAATMIIDSAGTSPTLPWVSVTKQEISAGETQTVTGGGFPAGATVNVEMHSTPVHLGTAIANAAGEFSFSFMIPAGTEAGAHTLVISSGAVTVEVPFAVKAATAGGEDEGGGNGTNGGGAGVNGQDGSGVGDGGLAATGNGNLAMTGAGALTLLVAAALAYGASHVRRRRQASNSR